MFTFLIFLIWIEGRTRASWSDELAAIYFESEVNERKFSRQLSLEDGHTHAIQFSKLILL